MCRQWAQSRLAYEIATHLNKATIETARMMILVAPEGAEVSAFDAVISQASDEAEKLEIAAINVEAALEDKGNG